MLTLQSLRGSVFVLIDDSLVRGTTANKVVRMMFDAGAVEVHLGISSPPILYPDFYGIDTPSTNELLASNHSLEEMTRIIGATSFFFEFGWNVQSNGWRCARRPNTCIYGSLFYRRLSSISSRIAKNGSGK